MNVQIDSGELKVLRERCEILGRLINSDERFRSSYLAVLDQITIENKIELVYEGFVDSLNDLLAEAEVDEPAGRGCGYAIRFDEEFVKHLLKQLVNEIRDIEGA